MSTEATDNGVMQTHYEGCWKDRKHHGCALYRIAKQDAAIEWMMDLVCHARYFLIDKNLITDDEYAVLTSLNEKYKYFDLGYEQGNKIRIFSDAISSIIALRTGEEPSSDQRP